MLPQGSFTLNSNPPPKKSIHHITLTSTLLSALEEIANDKEQSGKCATIQFTQTGGNLILSAAKGGGDQRRFSFGFSKDSYQTSSSSTVLQETGCRLESVGILDGSSIKIFNNLIEASKTIDTTVLNKEIRVKEYKVQGERRRDRESDYDRRKESQVTDKRTSDRERNMESPSVKENMSKKSRHPDSNSDTDTVNSKTRHFEQTDVLKTNAVEKRRYSDSTVKTEVLQNPTRGKENVTGKRTNSESGLEKEKAPKPIVHLETKIFNANIIEKRKQSGPITDKRASSEPNRLGGNSSEKRPTEKHVVSHKNSQSDEITSKRKHSGSSNDSISKRKPSLNTSDKDTTPESGYGTDKNSNRLAEFEEDEDKVQDVEELSEHTPFKKLKQSKSMPQTPLSKKNATSSSKANQEIDQSSTMTKNLDTDSAKGKDNDKSKKDSSLKKPDKKPAPLPLESKYPPVRSLKDRWAYQVVFEKAHPVYMKLQNKLSARWKESARLYELCEAASPDSDESKVLSERIVALYNEQRKDMDVPHHKYLEKKLRHLKNMCEEWESKAQS